MKMKERVISIAFAAIMVVAVCVTVAYADPIAVEVPAPEAAEAFVADVPVVETDEPGALTDTLPAAAGDFAQLTSFFGNLSQNQTDQVMSLIAGGNLSGLSGLDMADLLKMIGDIFPQGIPDDIGGLIPEQFKGILSALTGPDAAFDFSKIKMLLDRANDMLARALSEGVITQEQYDKVASIKEFGSNGLSDEQKDRLKAKLADAKEGALAKTDSRLDACLEEGMITVGLYDIIKSTMDTGKLEDPDALIDELKTIAGQLLVIGLDESDLITQGLYDILISAIETGDFEFSQELVKELQAILLGFVDMGLSEGKLSREQHDWLVKEIKIAFIQIEMKEWLPK